MGLEDRKWYRAERARLGQGRRTGGWRRAVFVLAGLAMVSLVLAVVIAPTCSMETWTAVPGMCARFGWEMLLDRITGHTAAVGNTAVAATGSSEQPEPGACGYYPNAYGHVVPRPCGNWRANLGAPPSTATALCNDGTYSFSEHPYTRGTCNYHGGVVQYLR